MQRKTLSLDLRQRILASYDQKEGNREEIARRYKVSLGMVKKLLQQRRRLGDIAPQHHRSGCKPTILPSHHRQMRALLGQKPDLTLAELRQAVGLRCTIQAIHYVLEKMDSPGQRTRPRRHCQSAAGVAAAASRLRSVEADLSG